MIYDEQRLRRTLGNPALERMVLAMRQRLRRGRGLCGTITLASPSQEERTAVDRLLQRRPTVGGHLSIRLSDIERILQDGGICDTLRDAIEAIGGPVEDQRAAKEIRARRWAAVFEAAGSAIAEMPTHRPWLEHLRMNGLLKRLSGGDCAGAAGLLQNALAVLRALPQPVVPLAEFSARVTGDSHALDAGTPLATLCLTAIARQHDLTTPTSAAGRRRLWDLAGIVVDELSAPALVLNLRADPTTTIGRVLDLLAEQGEPCHLTLRQLRQITPAAFCELSGSDIFICENPSVVAAAAQRLGRNSRPLVCTSGQPSSAAQYLLRLLADAGCQLLYHGDFDPKGIGIANMLHERFGAAAWRMGVADYTSAVAADGLAICRPVPAAIWDAELAGQMRHHERVLLEESVVDTLLSDLRVAEPKH